MRLVPKREVIGQADCPLMYRWTLVNLGNRLGKLMVHYFLPTARDRDFHDHPRSFVTFVFRGGYDDITPCPSCRGTATLGTVDGIFIHCMQLGCDRGRVTGRVRAPALRFRRADHAHITVAGECGAWSLCAMGPLRRDWGFWRAGTWWPWRRYEEHFGGSFRCEEPGS